MAHGKVKLYESDIQRAIVAWLHWHGWATYEFAKPGGHEALRGTVPVGWPDVLAIKDGVHRYIEVKVPGKNATLKQAAMHEGLRFAGCSVAVVHSVDELIECM